MSYTKAQARTFVKALLTDPVSDKWTPAALDVLISTTLDELWGDLLDVASYATSQIDTLATAHSPGYIDLRSTPSGGDLTQRLYRIQKVKRNGREYTEADRRNILVISNTELVSTFATWAVFGNQLWMFPLDVNNSTELQYSFMPASYVSLNDTDNLSWPEGTENAFLYEAAARALISGGNQLLIDENRAIGVAAHSKAKANVTRLGIGPFTMNTYDSPEEWGGNA